MNITETFYPVRRAQWRAWLRKHHATKREVWLLYPNKASGKPRLPYNDAVEEALCFGWIDSTAKKYDPATAAQRFTPRRNHANWSEPNKERFRDMVKAKLMTPAGFAVAPIEIHAAKKPPRTVLAKDIEAQLRAHPPAWTNYTRFPERYRRIRIGWIEAARSRPHVFAQRLGYFVRMTRQGKRYGMLE